MSSAALANADKRARVLVSSLEQGVSLGVGLFDICKKDEL